MAARSSRWAIRCSRFTAFARRKSASSSSAQQNAQVAGIPVTCLDLDPQFSLAGDHRCMGQHGISPGAPAGVRSFTRRSRVQARSWQRAAAQTTRRPTLDVVIDRAEEAATVVRRVREAQTAGSDEIAVLVQAPRHLDHLLPALRNEGIDYTAIELETLAQRSATRDLDFAHARNYATCGSSRRSRIAARAVVRPARLSGSAFLADKCGQRRDSGRIWRMIDFIARLTPDGQARIARLRAGLSEAVAQRGRTSLSRRVRAAWLSSAGRRVARGRSMPPAPSGSSCCLPSTNGQATLADWDAFIAATARLFARTGTSSRRTASR